MAELADPSERVRRSGGGTAERRPVLEDLSVVIPTLGRAILRDTLESIAAGTRWPARIVVVDQSSSSEVAGWLHELAERGLATLHVPSDQTGRAAGVNRGIERVETRFLAITDDDCRADPAWLAELAKVLRAHPRSVVSGRVEAGGEGTVAMVVTSRESLVRSRPSLKFDPLSGGNMAAATEVFALVGLLDEDPVLRCAEDGEWAYRALRAGVQIRYAPGAAVVHMGWRSPEERATQYRIYARSQGGFYGKYLVRGDAFIALRVVAHHVRALRRWLRGVLARDAELAMLGRAYATGLLPGVLAGVRRYRLAGSARARRP